MNDPMHPTSITISLQLPHYGPDGQIEVTLNKPEGANPFSLEPVRYRPEDPLSWEATEWYLSLSDGNAVDVSIDVNLGKTKEGVSIRWEGGPDDLTVVTPLRLGLSQLGVDPQAPYQVVRGSLAVELTPTSPKDDALAKLWPTEDLSHLPNMVILIEPSGLYVRGQLPGAFYASQTAGTPVTLRVPQDALSDDADQPISMWTLTAHEFRSPEQQSPSESADGTGSSRSSIDYVKEWVGKFAAFSLPGAQSARLGTFLDNAISSAGDACVVQIKPLTDPDSITGLEWEAQNIDTRLVIGGGSTAEANFFPQALRGRLNKGETGWDDVPEYIRFESDARIGGDLRTEPAGSVDLTLTQNAALSLRETQLKALNNPASTLDQEGPRSATAGLLTYRAWLCTATGWAALDSTRLQADIDPEAVTQGSVRGVIELSNLAAALGRANTAGVSVDVRGAKEGRVSGVLVTSPGCSL